MLTNNFKQKTFRLTAFASAITLLGGCIDKNENAAVTPSKHYAVISTQNADNTAGEISIISLEDYSTDNTNFDGLSDVAISTYGENFYRIGRFNQDNITKFQIDTPDTSIWQYSANGTGETKSNPYKLVIKNETTGYLIRYGQPTVWIIDPSVSNSADPEAFKTGEIDLSSYTAGGVDTTPEAADALLIENKLYILIQNLDTSWAPGAAYIAVFDTLDNNKEIETNTDGSTPKGIALKVTNPSKIEYLSSNKTLYVSGVGAYGKSYTTPVTPPDYAGGIERIALADYTTEIVVDDGSPYGQTTNVAILNSTRGYFVGYSGWQDTAVYSFNPTTGAVDTPPLMENKDVSDIEIGPLGNLWVANRDESGVTIFDTVDNTLFKALIDTGLKPNDIEFISVKD